MDKDTILIAKQLISIAPKLSQEIPNIQIIIAGDGDMSATLKLEVQEINKKLGRNCIVMTGSRTDINQIVAAGNIFVGVSRAALEAMASGKPVVVAGNEGYQGIFRPKILKEALTGNLCCRGMVPSTPERILSDVLKLFRATPSEQKTLGDYGRTIVCEHYSVGTMAQDCLDMYALALHSKHHVLVSGYYGFSNAGDDAILHAIQQNIGKEKDIHLTILSNNPASTTSEYGLDAVPRFHIPTVIRAIRQSDTLISGGGSLLQDTTSTRSILYYLLLIRTAHFFKKKVMVYANGIGPIKNPLNRFLVKKVLSKVQLITVRDKVSFDELSSIGLKNTNVHCTADPVFNLTPASSFRAVELLKTTEMPENTPFVAVSVRNLNKTDTLPNEIAMLCDHLHKKHNLQILFLLMQPTHDLAMSQAIQHEMTAPSYLLTAKTTPQELMAVLGRSKLCLAMRLHTLIFSACMSVPLLGIDYDPKVASYLRELGMPSLGKVAAFSGQTAITIADELMSDYDGYQKILIEQESKLSLAAENNDSLLLSLIRKK